MKTYGIVVFDNTCNVLGHDQGIYGANDYSWVTDTLNGMNGSYNLTEEEAIQWKKEYEKYAKENNLEWASFDIDYLEIDEED